MSLHTIKVYLSLIPIFFLIDYLWLGKIMSRFYLNELGPLARVANGSMKPVIWAAIAVYLLIPLGIVLFVLPTVNPQCAITSALWRGFVYGIVLYGVYDMTNYSLLESWSLKMAWVDIVWGGVLNAVASLSGWYLDQWYA